MPDFTYENMRRIFYGNGLTFIPVCPQCGRFVKSDDFIRTKGEEGEHDGAPNATCAKCGRVVMPCEGFVHQGDA
jgi:hypothetical protein